MTNIRPRHPGIQFPSELEIVHTREFEAPVQLVFDVFTREEHVRKTFAPFDEEVTVCEIDLRVGGAYHYVMVTRDGEECSFRGTFSTPRRCQTRRSSRHFGRWSPTPVLGFSCPATTMPA